MRPQEILEILDNLKKWLREEIGDKGDPLEVGLVQSARISRSAFYSRVLDKITELESLYD